MEPELNEKSLLALRAEIPGLEENLYLNHAYAGRSCRSVLGASAEAEVRWKRRGPGALESAREVIAVMAAARAALASLAEAPPECLALTHSTSMGVSLVLMGLDWRPGDELLIGSREHPGITAPARGVEARWGVTIRTFDADAPDAAGAMARAMGPQTRVIAFSHVLWTSGRVLPVAEIAVRARAAGALTLVDGAQAAGALPLRPLTDGVDFYAATCHKWVGGLDGTGFLVVAPQHLARATVWPTQLGYMALDPDDQDMERLSQTAARYECSTMNFADFAAVPEALAFLGRGGPTEARLARQVALAQRLRAGLRARPGARLLLEDDAGQRSGIVSWTLEGREPAVVADALWRQRRICIRPLPSPACLRASLHFYNTEADVDALLEGLAV